MRKGDKQQGQGDSRRHCLFIRRVNWTYEFNIFNIIPIMHTSRLFRFFAFWATGFCMALTISSLIPPLQSPDEDSHLMRAAMISQGHISLGKVDPRSSGALIDEGLLMFSEMYLTTVVVNSEARLSPTAIKEIEQITWTGRYGYAALPGAGYYLPAIYTPQAAGFWAGRSLNMSIANTYRLVRLCTLLASTGLLALAFTLMPPNPLSLGLIVLPMTLFQLSSPTVDGTTTGLAVLALSAFMSSLVRGSAALSITLAVACLLVATTRIHMMSLLVLPIFLGFRNHSRRDFVLGGSAVFLAISWVYFALTSTVDARVQRASTTGELVWSYLTHPADFIAVVGRSLADDELARFYGESFIGILGWLDTRLPLYFYPMLWAALGAVTLCTIRVKTLHEDWAARSLLLAIAIASAALVFFAMLVTWTPVPAVTIKGVQGRYFLGPALVLSFALSGQSAFVPPALRWWRWATLGVLGCLSTTALAITLWARYH